MKEKSQRIHDDRVHAKRQVKIAKAHGFPVDSAHRFEKTYAMTCGDSNCAMCGNPRKFFKEVTQQEKKLALRATDTD